MADVAAVLHAVEANLLHGLITNAAGLKLVGALARGGFLPVQTLLHLVR